MNRLAIGLGLALMALIAGALLWWHALPRDSQLQVRKDSTSVLANDTADLPASAGTILHNFYEADQERDRQRVGTLFTADTTSEDSVLHATLFPAELADGLNASDGYVVLDTVAQGSGWLLTVRENRVDNKGSELDTRLVQLLLVPSQTAPWAVERYSPVGSTGKYAGFLVE